MTNTRSLQRKLYNERGGAQLLTPMINLTCIVCERVHCICCQTTMCYEQTGVQPT